jgi:hypothetical protein
MSVNFKPTPSPATQATLECLQQAVSKTLERKRRLGQYSVQWSGNAPFAVGEDAPKNLRVPELSEDP